MSIFFACIDKVGNFTSAVGLLCVCVGGGVKASYLLLSLSGAATQPHLPVQDPGACQIDFKNQLIE